jgi:hypothetical protein
MMTAFKGGTKDNSVTPWDADDVGNGRVDLSKAARAGLVMHETKQAFLAANPATGGDPKTLNLASMRNVNCAPQCTWTRTVRNTRTAPSSWSAAGAAMSPGLEISVTPANFSFSGGLSETRQLTITARPTANLTSAVAFGEVVLTEATNQSPAQHMTVAIQGEPLVLSTVSRKTHGGTNRDIALPLTGTPAVEPRNGPAAGTHQMVVTFTAPVTLTGVLVSEGIGTATHSVSGSDVIVNLTGVPDVQRIAVTLTGVSNGTTTANVRIPMGVLVGDVNGDRVVNSGDALVTRNRSGQQADAANFRSDVNADGTVNGGDVIVVRGRAGNALP